METNTACLLPVVAATQGDGPGFSFCQRRRQQHHLEAPGGGEDLCVYFKQEASVREQTVNTEVDIRDIKLQMNAGSRPVSITVI